MTYSSIQHYYYSVTDTDIDIVLKICLFINLTVAFLFCSRHGLPERLQRGEEVWFVILVDYSMPLVFRDLGRVKLVVQVLPHNAVENFLAPLSCSCDCFCFAFSLDCRCSEYIWNIDLRLHFACF